MGTEKKVETTVRIFTSLVSFYKYRFKDTATASLMAVVVGVEEDACDGHCIFIVLFDTLTCAESNGQNSLELKTIKYLSFKKNLNNKIKKDLSLSDDTVREKVSKLSQ
ncbi:hypothetical protein BpHYR1_049827 [Brachionus plicatilis]|uniref:Uncharacterized protein n=1 Tax=Brachionus plicatilis TaxID=10195 RepID=A0A3M7SL17_BRAPC|nr:hypothetical protein BpHYR1_049827 [Brachionus plicatilis]